MGRGGKTRGDLRKLPRLFDPEALDLRQTGQARLRTMILRGEPDFTTRERRVREDRATMDRLRRWGFDLATRFGLRYTGLEPEADGVNEHYGICYSDGLIRIRLRHARTGRVLKESSLVDTLCHELAHLRHFDHGPRFKKFYLKILGSARKLGYYRPGPIAPPRPRQSSLFAEADRN